MCGRSCGVKGHSEILMGARYPREQIETMIGGIATMVLGIRGIEDSWVYQDILAQGLAEGQAKGYAEGFAQGVIKGIAETLIRIGPKTLGSPDEWATAAIMAITDRDRLDQLIDRVSEVATWDELLT